MSGSRELLRRAWEGGLLQGEVAERVDELRSGESIREAVRRAREAPQGRDGESARAAIRTRLPLAIAHWAAPVESEITARSTELAWEDLQGASVAAAVDPRQRASEYRRWEQVVRALEPLAIARRSALDSAARALGEEGILGLRSAALPESPLAVADSFERGLVAPLDVAVERASARQSADERFDVPAFRALRQYAPRVTRAAVARAIGSALPSGASAASGDGIDGLLRSLQTSGGAARVAFWARRDPIVPIETDPAFAFAAGELFRALGRSERFLAATGVAPERDLMQDVRFEEALRWRRTWAELSASLAGPERIDDVEARARRAEGRPATPNQRLAAIDGEVSSASALRGAALAALALERLLTRWGHGWYEERAARRWIEDLWDAEPGETAESVATALSLGTMDPAPLLDAWRP